jgi:hypothetical protein
MSNQMIALQARGPKLADPAAQTAKFVNMMNMTKQQEAAERQAAQAQQAMTLAQKKDAREEALQGPAVTKAEIDNVRAQIDDLEEQYKMVSTDEGHQFWLGRVRKISPEIADQIGMYVPNFDPEKINNIMLTAKQAADKIDPDAKATIEYAGKGGVDEQGNPIPEGTAIQVITGKKPSTQVIRNAPAAGAAAATPTAAAPSGSARTGKFGEALVVPDSARPLTPYQQDHIRSMQEGLGMSNTPASFSPGASAGQMTPQRAQQIVDAAVNTRVMAQEDFDQMLAMTPEQNKQPFMEMIRANNIKLQPGGMGQQPQFADLRGQRGQSQTAGLGGDMSMMRNTEAQYIPLQRRDPNVSPAPAEVSPDRLRAEATAKRQTPVEAAAITEAIENTKVKIQRDAKIEEETRTKTKGRKLFSTALNDMRSDYNTLNKLRAIPSTGRPMLDNIGDYIGASRVGRIAQSAVGSKASVALNNIANSRLTLLNALKEVTGMSAAQLSSNVELMTFLDSLADPTQGYESAMETIRRLENLYGAPAPAKRQTPTKSSSGWGQAKVVGN